MINRRGEDSARYAPFRTNRLFQEAGRWYFHTREATMEGPYDTQEHALERLAEYIKVMTSGWLSPDSDLQMQPIDQ